MWISRDMEADLPRLARQFPAILVTGARQTGKTAMLRHVFPGAHYISLDLPAVAATATENPSALLDAAKPSVPILIDEIQYAPGLFRHLKARIDAKRRNGRFLLTGSQTFPLMREASDSLAGRIVIRPLDTLSSREVLSHPDLAGTTVEDFLWRGGFPELHRDRTILPVEFYSSYVATYLERDLRNMIRVGSLRDFERFVRATAIYSGRLFNLSDVARDVGIAVSTAKEWLSALEASRQVFLLEPYFGNLKKRLVKSPKLYFRDTGLLSFLLGFDSPAALLRSAHLGSVWETFVANHLDRLRPAAARLFFLRDSHGLEVDFLLERNGRCNMVECKWSEVPEKRDAHNIEKARELLGPLAAPPHWIASRTPVPSPLPGVADVTAVDAFRFHDWWEDAPKLAAAGR